MNDSNLFRWMGLVVAVCLAGSMSFAATQNVDLDGQATNGAESQCELNVLQTFPVKIENRVTNKAVGDAFDFSWRSAGPGGFSSSVSAGTTAGVGAKWVWTTNQTVYSYTGGSCGNDICFGQTSGAGPIAKTCSLSCLADGAVVNASKGAAAGEVVLNWAGGQGPFTVYRSTNKIGVVNPANALGTTDLRQTTDISPAGSIFFYVVRGVDCTTRRSCASNLDCDPVTEGVCVNRGPFAVPGRSLFTNDVTVSSASLTSSLITFFSPPTEVFSVTSTAQPGGLQETLTNNSSSPVTITTEAFPPGCCPVNPYVPHQLRCGETCVDFLNDPDNCGACGNVCGEGACCQDGYCESICDEGWTWCDGVCVDFRNDNGNCGECGNACGDGTCCFNATCASVCEEGDLWCDGLCAHVQEDRDNCGACGNACGEGSCCYNGECTYACDEGELYCDGLCAAVDNDRNNCGACGNACGEEECCFEGVCAPLCDDDYSGCEGVCTNVDPTAPDGVCPNPDQPSSRGIGVCPNESPTTPVPGMCSYSDFGEVGVVATPNCEAEATTTTIPPGGSLTTCLQGGLVYKEVPTIVRACGDGIPGPDGACANGVARVSEGTFMRLVPDTSVTVGNAYLTPHSVQVVNDTSGDGLLEPGETASLIIRVLNAGPANLVSGQATLVSPLADLTDDGVVNPVGVTILSGSSPYGTIAGTAPSVNCEPVVLQPASNAIPFRVTVPAGHPGDTARPFVLQFTGTVNGAPFSMDVPIALGIADRCEYSAATRDFDGLDGLLSPMTKLVPAGDPVPFPSNDFSAGNTRPLKLRMFCGGVNLSASDVDAPEIVALSEATRGPLNIRNLNLNTDSSTNPNDPFFRFNSSLAGGQWIYNMRTALIGTGRFTLTIRIAGRKEYVTGFVLR